MGGELLQLFFSNKLFYKWFLWQFTQTLPLETFLRRVVMDYMASASDSQPQDRGFKSNWSQKNAPRGLRVMTIIGASVHSAVNEYLRQWWQWYLDYTRMVPVAQWSVHKRVYTPQGVEQVTDVTGLPGVHM